MTVILVPFLILIEIGKSHVVLLALIVLNRLKTNSNGRTIFLSQNRLTLNRRKQSRLHQSCCHLSARVSIVILQHFLHRIYQSLILDCLCGLILHINKFLTFLTFICIHQLRLCVRALF